MGVHLWHLLEDTHIWIPSQYPSSLIEHRSKLVWLSEGKIVVWSADGDISERTERNVKEVFSTERGLCWTEWVNDRDIICRRVSLGEKGIKVIPFGEATLYILQSLIHCGSTNRCLLRNETSMRMEQV